MNQVLPSDNMQFNNELLVSSSVFVGGFSSEIPNSSLAHDVSSNVGNRMRGMVRSGVITPMASPVVSNALEYVLKTTNFKSILLGEKVTGVSAGDTYLEDKEDVQEKEELKPKEEEIFSMPWLLEDDNNIIQPNPPKLKPEGDIRIGQIVPNDTGKKLIKNFLAKGDEYIDNGLDFVGKKFTKFKEKNPKTALMLQGIGVLNSKISAGFEDPIIKPIERKFGELNREYIINPSLEYLDIQPGEKGYRLGSGLIGCVEGVITGKMLLGVNNIVALDLAGSEAGYHFAKVNNVSVNFIQKNLLVEEYLKNMSKPIVRDEKLFKAVERLYRPNPKSIGNGSTMDAVRHELKTNIPTGGKFEFIDGEYKYIPGKFHLQKLNDEFIYLQDWLRNNPNALRSDIQAAQNILQDIVNIKKDMKK